MEALGISKMRVDGIYKYFGHFKMRVRGINNYCLTVMIKKLKIIVKINTCTYMIKKICKLVSTRMQGKACVA